MCKLVQFPPCIWNIRASCWTSLWPRSFSLRRNSRSCIFASPLNTIAQREKNSPAHLGMLALGECCHFTSTRGTLLSKLQDQTLPVMVGALHRVIRESLPWIGRAPIQQGHQVLCTLEIIVSHTGRQHYRLVPALACGLQVQFL